MSLSRFFYEPFYSLSDFDRLFDEAFTARTDGNGAQGQGQVQRRETNGRSLRPRQAPRYTTSSLTSDTDHGFTHRMDIHDDAKTNTVTATFELPGLKKEDVSIDVHDNILTVSGESKVDEKRDENGWAVRERRYGKFSRSVPLPQGIKVC